MKIVAPTLIPTFERTRKSEDATGEKRRERPQDQDAGSGKKDQEEKERFTLEALTASVENFSQDPGVLGLNAELQGAGPGLRVTLKDGSGAVIRQFTGEEFLRLREAAQGVGRGRILDKKL